MIAGPVLLPITMWYAGWYIGVTVFTTGLFGLAVCGCYAAAMAYAERRRCPQCRGVVPQDAIRCRHCGSVLSEPPPVPPLR
ncbi:MAG: hypothetical protein A2W31_06565 [Planctomycetes bacterium RBG_16_64_10]|nr:MAG: hypothetical protein A2W31_06565 [Planctomycetes bacterium RBG_16_64_10]